MGFITGHNTLRKYIHLMGLNNCPLCRRCGAEDETSASVCECEYLVLLRHVHLNSFPLYPEEINTSNATLNPICHLLALLRTHHILHVIRIRVNPLNAELNSVCHLLILLGDLTFMGKCIVSISNRCNVKQFIYIWKLLTCFGWYFHPSSGAHTTVSTASGICHNTVTAI
jgi:ribosomal protein L40E